MSYAFAAVIFDSSPSTAAASFSEKSDLSPARRLIELELKTKVERGSNRQQALKMAPGSLLILLKASVWRPDLIY